MLIKPASASTNSFHRFEVLTVTIVVKKLHKIKPISTAAAATPDISFRKHVCFYTCFGFNSFILLLCSSTAACLDSITTRAIFVIPFTLDGLQKLVLHVCNESGRVLVCTYWRNGLRGLQDRPVDLSFRGQLGVRGRLDGAVISLEVDSWWRKGHVTPLYKKVAFQNQ